MPGVAQRTSGWGSVRKAIHTSQGTHSPGFLRLFGFKFTAGRISFFHEYLDLTEIIIEPAFISSFMQHRYFYVTAFYLF